MSEEFIDYYLNAVNSTPTVMPNIYCSRTFLRAKNFRVYTDASGNTGFRRKGSKLFVLPPVSEHNGKYIFTTGVSEIEFPASSKKGKRFDIQFVTERNHYMTGYQRVYNFMNLMMRNWTAEKKIPMPVIEGRSLPFSDKSRDTELNNWFIRKIACSQHLPKYFPELVDRYLFEDLGQHRFIMLQDGEIVGVYVWDDNGFCINELLYLVSMIHISDGNTFLEFRSLYRMILYMFVSRFPMGTLFNLGGCYSNNHIYKQKMRASCLYISEVRTMAIKINELVTRNPMTRELKMPWEMSLDEIKTKYRHKTEIINNLITQAGRVGVDNVTDLKLKNKIKRNLKNTVK